MAFTQASYEAEGWRSALDDDLYQRLGLPPSPVFSPEEVRQAYLPRYQWWQHKQELISTGQQPPIIMAVGPYVGAALRNLGEARRILADSEKSRDYYRMWQRRCEEAWKRDLSGLLQIALDDGWLTPGEKQGILQEALNRGIPEEKAEEIIDRLMQERGARYGHKPEPIAPALNFYELLEIGKYATAQEIEEAYRREHSRYINDRDKARAAARFSMVSQAYEILRDPARRAAYDRKLRQGEKAVTGSAQIPGQPRLELSSADGKKPESVYRFNLKLGEQKDGPVIIAKNGGGGALDAEVKTSVPWLAVIDPDTGTPLRRIQQAALPQQLRLRLETDRDPTLNYAATRTGEVEFSYIRDGATEKETITIVLQIETVAERVEEAVTTNLIGLGLLHPVYLYLLFFPGLNYWGIIYSTFLSLMVTLLFAKRYKSSFVPLSAVWAILSVLYALINNFESYLPFFLFVHLPLPLTVLTVKNMSARNPLRSTIFAFILPFCFYLLFGTIGYLHYRVPATGTFYQEEEFPVETPEETPADLVLERQDGDASYYILYGEEELEAEIAFSGRCWVRIRLDGVEVEEKTFTAGKRLTYGDCTELFIRLGNPEAAQITINGFEIDCPWPDPHNVIVTLENRR